MTHGQMKEFRSRVDRIQGYHGLKKGFRRRDKFGNIVSIYKKGEPSRTGMILRSLIILFVGFTVMKSVVIYNVDAVTYSNFITHLQGGDERSQLVASALTPDRFSEPVGKFTSLATERVIDWKSQAEALFEEKIAH